MKSFIWKNGRDNSRTPMQWTDGKNAGFTTGTPWLKMNPNFSVINVEQAMNNPDSIYHYYKKLIQLRKENPILVYGDFELILPEHEQIFAYMRRLENEKMVVITNLFPVEIEFLLPFELGDKSKEIVISNYQVIPQENIRKLTLKPYEARVYRLR